MVLFYTASLMKSNISEPALQTLGSNYESFSKEKHLGFRGYAFFVRAITGLAEEARTSRIDRLSDHETMLG